MQYTFNIVTPANSTNMFGNWLDGVEKDLKAQIRVGACALLWAIWNTRNDFVFNKSKTNSFLQVIPRATHWIRMWSYLQPEELRQDMDSGCNRLETVARDLCNRFGWRPFSRITC